MSGPIRSATIQSRRRVPPAAGQHRRPRGWRVGTVLAAAVGSMYFVGAGRALDYDGSVTVGLFVRRGSLLDVFRTPYAFNNHPYFSFFEHLVWDAGAHGDAWLRIVPIACAAATVGILTAWATQRWGATAGVIGGAVLAANPMFAELGRSVRGYSLMVLGCTVATIILVDSHGRPGPTTKRHSTLYVVALGVAIGTQFYAVLVLAAHLATLMAQHRFDSAWRRRTAAVVAVGVLPYAAMLRALLASTRDRHGAFAPGFPIDAARAVLGQQPVAVIMLAALAIFALSVSTVRRSLRPAGLAIAIALLTIWIVLHPLDLYPRFLVWLVPAVAIGAAASVARRPPLAPLAIVAILAMALSQATSWTTDPIASRHVARLVETARASGQTPCAAGHNTEVILGYTRPVRSVFTVAQLSGCDLLFADADTSARKIDQFSCYFTTRETLPGRIEIVVLAHAATMPDRPACRR